MFLGYYTPSTQKWSIPVKIAMHGDRNQIIGLNFVSSNQTEAIVNDSLPKYVQDLRLLLDEYFSKGRIDHLEVNEQFHLVAQLKTPFIKKVLHYVSKIPAGKVQTYGEVGRNIECKGARAIGMALRSNPFPILIPCHRVVSKTSLGGFMGATDVDGIELKIKETLLRLEGWNSS